MLRDPRVGGIWHVLLEEIDQRIAKALARIGVSGTTIDGGSIGGAIGDGVVDHGVLFGLGDDDHAQYQKESEKAQASGYASLDSGTKVPTDQLGSGTANSTTFLRGDQTWGVPGGGGGSGDLVKLDQVLCSGGESSISFPSIPGDYTNLIVAFSGRGEASAASVLLGIQFNSDTGANYDRNAIFGNHTTVTGGATVADTSAVLGVIPAATAGANRPGVLKATIFDYAATAFYKAFTGTDFNSRGTATTDQFGELRGGLWRNTAAITDITLLLSSGNFAAGSRATLYGEA